MKKTLLALTVSAFAASAYAAPVFENESTKVDFWGSLRIAIDNSSRETVKETVTSSSKTKQNGNTQLRNQGSRFGVDVNHQLGNGYYALGQMHIRFDNDDNSITKTNNNNGFGQLHTRRLWAGFGKKELGQLTFGEQLTLADNYYLKDDKVFGINKEYITTEAPSVMQYTYKGIDGLTLGANYNFARTENARGTKYITCNARGVCTGQNIKNEFGFGALYQYDVADNQRLYVRGGYGRTNYDTQNTTKHYHDGYAMALGYEVGAVKVFTDLGYKFDKNGSTRTKSYYVSPGVHYKFNDKTRLVVNYLHEDVNAQTPGVVDYVGDSDTNSVLAFVEYKLHKNVNVFVEGTYVKTKSYSLANSSKQTTKTTDKTVAVGMHVNW